jgi:hypothetical protein
MRTLNQTANFGDPMAGSLVIRCALHSLSDLHGSCLKPCSSLDEDRRTLPRRLAADWGGLRKLLTPAAEMPR